MFFKDFNELYEALKSLDSKAPSQSLNINNDCNVFVNDEVLYVQVPAVGIEKEDVSIELTDNILVIKGEISKESDKVDIKTIKTGFILGNIESKVKLSQKYNDGSFDVKVENGLIQIKITPKEKEQKIKKIF